MNNFTKAIIGTTLAVGSLFGTVQSAEAGQCVYGNGYELCFEVIGYNKWNVGIRNNHATEIMTVQCNGKYVDSWRSRGGLNQSEASYLASYFCSL